MNAIAQQQTRVDQRLNHVEFVHRPGERALVHSLFRLLGWEPMEMWEGVIILGIVDPPTFNELDNDNVLAGREVRPEQWAFDQALAEQLKQEPLKSAFQGQKDMLAQNPQWGMHFGYHMSTLERWEAAVKRLEDLETLAPELKGRAKLLKVFRPDDPKPFSPLHQAFLWTDIIASGSLALGQRIEISARVR
jgi:hypothetical protein